MFFKLCLQSYENWRLGDENLGVENRGDENLGKSVENRAKTAIDLALTPQLLNS
jgi:hypothetical protein